MSTGKPNPLVRWFPSLTDFAFLAPALLLFARMEGAHTMLGDGDTGWHVRTGEWILSHGRVPHRDMFSFTKSGEPWFAWEWLSDVLFAWLHQHAGMAAVVLAGVALLCGTFALLYRLARRRCANVLIAIAVTVTAAAGSSIHWLARPHLFSMLFLVIFYSILERAEEQEPVSAMRWWKIVLLLPLLTVLWTNLHGGFFVGTILVGGYAAGAAMAAVLARESQRRQAAWARARLYLASVAGCLAASLVNPYFYHLHVHIFRYLTEPYHFRNIVEFLSISFHVPAAHYFEPILLLGGPAVFWSLYRARYAHAGLVAVWAHLALVSARNVPLYLILATPVVARMLDEWCGLLGRAPVADWLRGLCRRAGEFAAEISALDRLPRLHVVSAMVFLVLAALFYAPAPPSGFRAEYDPQVYPAEALAALGSEPFHARIFTNDEWGDYLIYRLYPRTRVFIDGRSDFYGPAFAEQYLQVMKVAYNWQANLDRFGIDAILLPPDAPLAGVLKESKRWHVTYDDGVAILFRPVAGGQPESGKSSVARRSDGPERDREITNSEVRDQTITKSKT